MIKLVIYKIESTCNSRHRSASSGFFQSRSGFSGLFSKFKAIRSRRIFSSLIANDIVSVQPMTSPAGQIFYLDYKLDKNNKNVKI